MSVEILIWAGQNFASGVVGSAGGLALSAALEAIGLQAPADARVLAKLEEMDQKLTQIISEINGVKTLISDLSKKLDIVKLELQIEIGNKSLTDAKASIPTHYSDLISLVKRRKAGEIINPASIKTFADNILGTWDIAKHVTAISQALLETPNEDHPSGLLQGWTELFIDRMGKRKKSPKLYNFYLNLESRFLQYLGTQIQGVLLVLTAKNYGAEPGSISKDAANYLWEKYFGEALWPQVEHFRWCAYRLALSQGEFRSPAPIAEMAGLPPDLQKILLRTDLIALLARDAFMDRREVTEGDLFSGLRGLYTHVLAHESDLTGGKGPEKRPWGTSPYYGRVIDRFAIPAVEWLPASGNYAQLAEPDQSQLRAVRYMWPFKSIQPPLNANFHEGKPWNSSLNYYDQSTLEPVGPQATEPGRLAAAHITDLTRLLSPVRFNQPQAADAAWSYDRVNGIDSDTTVTKNLEGSVGGGPLCHILRPPTPYYRFHADFEVARKQPRVSEHLVSWRIQGPVFQFQGKEPANLKLHLWLSMSTFRRLYMPRAQMAARLKVILKSPYGEHEVFDSHNLEGGKMNLWNWPPDKGLTPILNATTTVYGEYSGDFSFTVGKTRNQLEKYDVIFDLEVNHKAGPGWVYSTVAGVEFHIKDFSFSWA